MTMQAVEPLSLSEISAARLAELQVALPAWSGEITDPVYKAYVENGAMREFARRELENAHALALDPRTAVGSDLDAIGLRVLLARHTDETDAAYRVRILRGDGLADIESAGTVGYYRRQVQLSDSRIESVGIEFAAAPARQIRAYILTSEAANGTPSQTVRSAVDDYMKDRTLLDYTLQAPAPTITAYTITAVLEYDSGAGIAESEIELAARTAVYAHIRRQRAFGSSVRRSAIIAALSVAGVDSVTLSAPASDLTPAVGDKHTAYYCPPNTTGVTLTLTSI